MMKSCKKEITAPAVITVSVSGITQTSAVSGGNVTDDGGAEVIKRGVCWGTTQDPASASNHTRDGAGTGTFISNITGLTANTKYYIWAWALNSIGMSYGNENSFITNPVVLATITTPDITSINSSTAVCGGNITSNGGGDIIERGICWAIHQKPTIKSDRTSDGTGSGSFTSEIKCLSFATTYYVRAYATNSAGTAYGNEQSFTTLGTNPVIFNSDLTYGSVSDIEGNCYKTIQIGNQTWMAENLRTTKYNDGTPMPEVTDVSAWLVLDENPGYCWYENEIINKQDYGALYNWGAVKSGKLCPDGWHIPADSEWHQLILFLDPEAVSNDYSRVESFIAGGNLKEKGTSHFMDPNTGADNESGFTAIPGGLLQIMGSFNLKGESCLMWSSTMSEVYPGKVWVRIVYFEHSNVIRYSHVRQNGFYVRCLED